MSASGQQGFFRLRPLDRLAVILPAAIVAAVVLIALLADEVAMHDPLAQDVSERLKSPGPGHIFGTDGFGRDVFSRVVYGSRASLYVGFLSVATASVVGIIVGMVSAYVGGRFDLVLQRLTDILLGFPFLVLALIVIVTLKASPTSVAAAIAVGLSPQIARVSRACALTVKSEPYILAAKLCGARSRWIIFRHLLPNSLSPILAQITGYLGVAMVAEATLSFLGLGVPPPFPSWGRMLQEGARQYFEAAPWVTVFPGLALSVTVLSLAILGDAIRDLLDPRVKR